MYQPPPASSIPAARPSITLRRGLDALAIAVTSASVGATCWRSPLSDSIGSRSATSIAPGIDSSSRNAPGAFAAGERVTGGLSGGGQTPPQGAGPPHRPGGSTGVVLG